MDDPASTTPQSPSVKLQSAAESVRSTFQREEVTPECNYSADQGILSYSDLSRIAFDISSRSEWSSGWSRCSSDTEKLSDSELARLKFDIGPSSPTESWSTGWSRCSSDTGPPSASELSPEDSHSCPQCQSSCTPSWMREHQSNTQLMIEEIKQHFDEELSKQRSALEREHQSNTQLMIDEIEQHFDEELSIQRSALERERELRRAEFAAERTARFREYKLHDDQIAAERIARVLKFAEERKARDRELIAAMKAWNANYTLDLHRLSLDGICILIVFVVVLLAILALRARIF